MFHRLMILIKAKNKKELILNYFGIRETYSQNAEDIILNTDISKEIGTYIDIGANEPIKFNNLYLFYKKGWTGINIEPNKYLYDKLCKKRKRDINLNIGIGNGEELTFYTINPHTLSTFDEETANSYVNMGHKIDNTTLIKTRTLENIFEEYFPNKQVDILSVDVEGFDMKVLESNNRSKYKPTYIILETIEYSRKQDGKKLNKIFDDYLFDKGYSIHADTHINTIYKLDKDDT